MLEIQMVYFGFTLLYLINYLMANLKAIMLSKFFFSTFFLMLFLVLSGCKKSDEVTEIDRARWAKEDAQNEAMENEAHTQHQLWYEVRADGKCRDIGSSARVEVNSWQSYPPSIDTVRKSSDGNYAIKYRISAGLGREKIYTTSYQWCESLQKKS